MTRGGRTLVCPAWDCPAHGQTKVRPTFQDYSSAFLPALDGALDRGWQSGGRPIAGEEGIVQSSSARRAPLAGPPRGEARGVVAATEKRRDGAHPGAGGKNPFARGVSPRYHSPLRPARALGPPADAQRGLWAPRFSGPAPPPAALPAALP